MPFNAEKERFIKVNHFEKQTYTYFTVLYFTFTNKTFVLHRNFMHVTRLLEGKIYILQLKIEFIRHLTSNFIENIIFLSKKIENNNFLSEIFHFL